MGRSRNIGGRIEHAEFVMSIPASALLLLFRYPPRPFRHLASPPPALFNPPPSNIRRARFRRDYVSATSPRSKGGRWWWWLGGSDGTDPILEHERDDFGSRCAIFFFSFLYYEKFRVALYIFERIFERYFQVYDFSSLRNFYYRGKKSFFFFSFFTTFGERTLTFNTSKLKKKSDLSRGVRGNNWICPTLKLVSCKS